MSNNSDSAPQTSQSSRLDLFNLRQLNLADLTRALASAASRAQVAATGQSTFTTDADLKTNHALLRLLPILLNNLPEKPPRPPPQPVITARRGDLPKNLPRPPCPICLELHWVAACPRKHEHDHDTLMNLMSRQSEWYIQAEKALREQEIIQ